jgi:hypothetical protein
MFQNQKWLCHPKTPHVLSVMMERQKTVMLFCSVMDVILRFIKVRHYRAQAYGPLTEYLFSQTAMVFLTFPKANGFAESAPFHLKIQWYALTSCHLRTRF